MVSAMTFYRKLIPADEVLPLMIVMGGASVILGYTVWHTFSQSPDIVWWDKERRQHDWLATHPKLLEESQAYNRTPFRWMADFGNQYYRDYTKHMYSDHEVSFKHYKPKQQPTE